MGSASSKFKKYLQHGDEFAAMQVLEIDLLTGKVMIHTSIIEKKGFPGFANKLIIYFERNSY